MKNDIVVLIPHFNDNDGLIKSVKSISAEETVDILIIDDGSTINKINEDLINVNFHGKGQISFVYLNENKGIEIALNHGLDLIKMSTYNYIARLDSGDTCISNRFFIQKEFLKDNSDVSLIGSNVVITDINENVLFEIIVPTNCNEIRNKMFVSSSTVIHPSIMFKKEILFEIGNYPTNYKAAEDYAFYFNVLRKYNISNVNAILLAKELNAESISIKKRKMQAYSRVRVIRDNYFFGFYPTYGLVRNYLLYLVPNKILIAVKKILKNRVK